LIKKSLFVFCTFLSLLSFGQSTEQVGICSYYADKFHGRKTSSGELYNKNLFTAAHRTLPYNTVVQLTNLRNQKKVLVKINDRGPGIGSRIIDISKAAAIELDIIPYGVAKVKLEVVNVPPIYLKQDTIVDPITSEDVKKEVSVQEVKKEDVNNKNTILNADNQPSSPTGYGVQIGYYKILNNCKNQLCKMQAKYGVKGYIIVEPKAIHTYYRLIMGENTSKSKAIELLNRFKNEIPGCFLYTY